jgi:hypothetical protein
MEEAMKLRIIASRDMGEAVDITEGVKALYDIVLSSAEWGSDMMSWEDALDVAKIGEVCGFEEAQRVRIYSDRQRFEDEQDKFIRGLYDSDSFGVVRAKARALRCAPMVKHDHVPAFNGKCVWPGCTHTE